MIRLARRQTRFAVVLGAAALLAAILVGASQLGARDEETLEPGAAPAVTEEPLLAGIPQRGPVLGRATAPVTLVEYADLQCPYCAQWARQTLPVLIDEYVRPGKLRIVFRGLAFIGPDSDRALRAALAAGRQDRLWNVVDGLYRHQGAENAGWVSEELLGAIAEGIRGLDGERMLAERPLAWVDREIEHAADEARRVGVPGTPAFEVGPTGGPLELVELSSLSPEGIRPAIEATLAR